MLQIIKKQRNVMKLDRYEIRPLNRQGPTKKKPNKQQILICVDFIVEPQPRRSPIKSPDTNRWNHSA
ncbi:hypothetical protein [Microcoleus sp. MON2_D5]|uniref:hypothetical protein n=1 Tax=Microcoleus sp. MON2_D5 TaxID=2818833 RepID=UPI002FD13CB4